MIARLWRLAMSHPANVVSLSAIFGLLLVTFGVVETRLMIDLPEYVRVILGISFIALFGYTLVAGEISLFKLKLAKASICLVTAGALWLLHTSVYRAGYDIFGCEVRFRDPSKIDWQYVRQEVAQKLNRRKHPRPFVEYTRKLVAEDIAIQTPSLLDEPSWKSLAFFFTIPDYAPRIMGAADRCGTIEVW
jgi:hypothetical protein